MKNHLTHMGLKTSHQKQAPEEGWVPGIPETQRACTHSGLCPQNYRNKKKIEEMEDTEEDLEGEREEGGRRKRRKEEGTEKEGASPGGVYLSSQDPGG